VKLHDFRWQAWCSSSVALLPTHAGATERLAVGGSKRGVGATKPANVDERGDDFAPKSTLCCGP